MDSALAGEERVFGIEALAVDPLFVRLAGGVVPSIDSVYRDLCRFDEDALETLHSMVVDHGLALIARRKHRFVHIDVDTTVEPLFGMQEGALPGPNPRYHGRPSYHPILARIAEADAIVGAKLRPGDTSCGEADVPFVEECIDRARAAAPSAVIYVVPHLASWRTPWLRRALILVPGRLARSGRGTTLHVPERSQLARWLN
ncbi:uncharacterized protein SOCE26_001810 [Sorangium cellulosum]|uniref:Transposase DDE domain-containing protein n=1 Tax=Sorangium cellulosum TaxID=56 RepID=A0A2L0EHP1_SORCE|nr:uncharacterized protein SOCE26_001810 [Sorangium cellulosum]